MTEPLAQPLITFCEENFDCELGPARAFFELPQRGEPDPVRVSYVTYAIEGPSYEACESWLIDNVFTPLAREACDEARLYWRLPEAFEVEPLRDRVKVRTRLAVLDKNMNQVYIAEKVKREGEPCTRIEP